MSSLKAIKAVGNNYCYLVYMAIRLIECHQVLKDAGSIYLHCDPTMSHYLEIVMDSIIVETNLRDEIVWRYPNRLSQKRFLYLKLYDTLFCYSKTNDFLKKELLDDNWQKSTAQMRREQKGREFYKGKLIIYDMDKACLAGHDLDNADWPLGKTGRKRINSVWVIDIIGPAVKKRKGYPTQKPRALLEHIIKTSSNEGALVLDPFCGCATTCVAAERLGRPCIGINISVMVYELVKDRIAQEVQFEDGNNRDLIGKEIISKFKASLVPERTDQGLDCQEKKSIYVISNPKYKVGIAKGQKEAQHLPYLCPNRGYKLDDE